jgi:hypothetical protein
MDAITDELPFAWLRRLSFWPCCYSWEQTVAPIDFKADKGGDLHYHFNIKPELFDDVKND